MFVFTSCTNNYIPKARILASSLKHFHPDWTFCLLLGEPAPEGFDVANEAFDRVVFFEQLGIQNYLPWLFRHRIVEICTAAKGPALHHFLTIEGQDKVMYLDPDIMVCNSLSPLDTLLDSHDILLTPHLLAPQPTKKSIEDNEISTLQHGVFNLGFVAVANRGQGPDFSSWWRDRLLEYCYDDIPRGLFTDQRWCDLAPAFFSTLHIVRDPGYNAASWNLTDRTITQAADGTFMANDVLLRFYHFTGYDSGSGAGMTSCYAANMPVVFTLWDIYAEKLRNFGHENLRGQKWRYMFFDNKVPITDHMRLVYRQHPYLQQAFPDPYFTPGYLEWYQAAQNSQGTTGTSRLKSRLRKLAHFLKSCFADNGGLVRGFCHLSGKAWDMVRREGIREALCKVRAKVAGCEPAPKIAIRPSLEEMLTSPIAMDSLHLLLQIEARPLLVIEHDWGGGAAHYLDERVVDWQREGRAVLRVRYSMHTKRLELLAQYQSSQVRCWVKNLQTFANPAFSDLSGIVLNELASWYLGHRTDGVAHDSTMQQVMQAAREIAVVARIRKLPIEVLCHDFYMLCPRINMVQSNGCYCGEQGLTGSACDACLKGDYIVQWRKVWRDVLDLSQPVVFFSKNTQKAFEQVYSLRPEQACVRPHLLPSYFSHPIGLPECGTMRVAVVGNITLNKGALFVRSMAKILKKRSPNSEVVIVGKLDVQNIPDNVRVLGDYARKELPQILEREKITIAALVSICPETFCYVAHELAALGVPLVSPPLGAQGDLVAQLGSKGRVAADLTPEALVEALLELEAAQVIQC